MKPLRPHFASMRFAFMSRILSIVALLVSADAIAAGFAEGDQIKVKRATPMLFRAEKFRDANEGETFNVLAYRPELKKVFVLSKGKDGKDVALSIDETAVQLVPADPVAALAAAKTAMAAKRFADASAVIAAAMRTNPGDASLSSALSAVKETEAGSKAIVIAKATAGRTAADIIRIRKNASVIDHPSALFSDDTSNQTRAAAMQKHADALEQKAAASLREAEGKYAAALSAFNRLVDRGSSESGVARNGEAKTTSVSKAEAERVAKDEESFGEIGLSEVPFSYTFAADWTEDQIESVEIKGIARIIDYNPILTESVFALQALAQTEEHRKWLRVGLNRFGRAGNRDERVAATANLQDALKRLTGKEPYTLTRTVGHQNMIRGLSEDNKVLLDRVAGNHDQSMNRNLSISLIGKLGLNQGTGLSAKEAGEIANTFFVACAPEIQADLLKAVRTEDFGTVLDKRWNDHHDHLLAFGINRDRIDRLKAQGTNVGLRTFLENTRRIICVKPEFANMKSAR